MDAKYLHEIEAREQAATPGQWVIDTNEPFSRQINGIFAEEQEKYVFYHPPYGEDTISDEDAAFIAHARTDIPELVTEVRSMQIENAQLRAIVEQSDSGFFARKCRVCGCDWNHPCEGGCSWVGDDLCSQCLTKILRGEING